MALVFRGQIINKEAIAKMDQPIDDEVWNNLSQELTALCRFCSETIEEYRQILMDTNSSQLFSYDEWREEHGDTAEALMEGHEEANPLHHLLEGNLRQRVMDAIDALPEREKMVLTLYYQEELNLKEIGAVLDVGESRVSQLHSQAIKRLRARLANDH